MFYLNDVSEFQKHHFILAEFVAKPHYWLYSSATNYQALDSLLPVEVLPQPLITL